MSHEELTAEFREFYYEPYIEYWKREFERAANEWDARADADIRNIALVTREPAD